MSFACLSPSSVFYVPFESSHFPVLTTDRHPKHLCCWFSETNKPEPQSEKSCVYALELTKSGYAFYRTKAFSVRGTFYFGKWEHNPITYDLSMHLTSYNNMKMVMAIDVTCCLLYDSERETMTISLPTGYNDNICYPDLPSRPLKKVSS
eukprot:TRINITY_DN13844_c0_g1_i1.p1 TRINITY_DN13844_c0_g1~~TRINITY_DN13844_c0_g1_i1.p1  ORF type:complete len:149 (-),score=2.93 TRINITY_DN13844_c0_g1_i1:25-471(-)